MVAMATFRLRHRHRAEECPVCFAAWRGFQSPLRHRPTHGGCQFGVHEWWWDVQADNAEDALALLPPFVAKRTEAVPIGEVSIP